MKSLRWVVAFALSALVALAGCSYARPSVAAEVGATTITDAQVEAATTAVATALASEPMRVRPAVLQWLVLGELSRQLNARNQLGLTDAQRESSARASRLSALMDDPATRDFALNGGDFTYVSDKLGSLEEFQQQAAGIPVMLNPRYGTWDPATLVIGEPGGLSQPFPRPTASESTNR